MERKVALFDYVVYVWMGFALLAKLYVSTFICCWALALAIVALTITKGSEQIVQKPAQLDDSKAKPRP